MGRGEVSPQAKLARLRVVAIKRYINTVGYRVAAMIMAASLPGAFCRS